MSFVKFTFLTIFFIVNHFTIINSSNSFVAKVSRDESTSLYTLLLSLKNPLQPTTLLLDLSSKYSWIDCSEGVYISSTDRYIPCNSHQCNSLASLACSEYCFDQPSPGCHNNSCGLFPENPVIKNTVLAQALVDTVGLSVTDGHAVTGEVGVVPNFVFSCSDTSLLRGFPDSVSGLAGFGRFNYSLPSQASEDDALSKMLFGCCQHLRRVIGKNHTMMANMEAYGANGVALESLEALRKTQERHWLLLAELNNLLHEAKVGAREEEANAIKMNEFK